MPAAPVRAAVPALILACALLPRLAASDDPAASGAPAQATDLNNQAVAEAQAGRFEEGVRLLRQALALNPNDATARTNLSGILTDWAGRLDGRGRVDEAIAALRDAVQLDPANGMALVHLGDLLYLRRSRMEEAVQAWRLAHGKVPDPVWQAVATRITQAQRDQLIERGYAARQTAHFDIRFQQANEADVSMLERVLETAYARLAEELGTSPSRLTVIIYTDRDLRRTYYQRDWALGFYDGRIRLRLEELSQADVADMAAHELAHAFLQHAYPGPLPTWVHEGYAQRQERERSLPPEIARLEQGIQARTQWIPLKWLDRHFEQPTGREDVARAYLEAHLAVDELIRRFGMKPFVAFLAQLSTGAGVEPAYDLAFAPSRWARADHGVFE